MGKISYRPRKHQGKDSNRLEVREENVLEAQENEVEETKENFSNSETDKSDNLVEQIGNITKINIQRRDDSSSISAIKHDHKSFENLKVIGDMECDYHIYLEDYVYTYLYQYAHSDLSRESAAFLIGEIYAESKETVIRGILPVKENEITSENEWIDNGVLDRIERERQAYFPDQDIIGWLHMQPGYGTMLTMKELREHQDVFAGEGTICLLVDAINKIETFFVYDEDELKEQSGYCMYYERNEEMQRYMLDHPFKMDEQEEIKDNVVNQFREIGKIRKEEYMQRKQVNVAVMAASIILIALTAVIVRMNGEVGKNDGEEAKAAFSNSQVVEAAPQQAEGMDLIIKPAEEISGEAEAAGEEANSESTEGVDEVAAFEEGLAAESAEPDAAGAEQKVSIAEEEAANSEAETEDIEYEIYVVKSGDTLADISYRQYGEARKSLDIAKLNGLDSTDCIYVGQELKIPKYE